MQYLTSWRMQCGARLLREAPSSVAAIALEVGYDSEAAFSRGFKRATELPPGAWRRAHASSSVGQRGNVALAAPTYRGGVRAKVVANVAALLTENERPPVPSRPSMQMIIEARLVDDLQETARIQLAVIDREMTTSPLGLSLTEGKALSASAQQYLVLAQCEGIGAAHALCKVCGAGLTMKGWRERQIRTVLGRVKVRSPRVRCCSC